MKPPHALPVAAAATFAVAFFLVGLPGCEKPGNAPPQASRVLMATTTSTANSGLLDALLPVFQKETGISVHYIAVGTGAALEHGRQGDVDVVLVHAPQAEKAFVAGGYGVKRIPVMYNDFVLLGPPRARDQLAVCATVVDAFRRIADLGEPFISRGDRSGTHIKEQAIWKEAGFVPSGPWYREAGQGMGATLLMADEKQAFVLCDRGTYLARKNGLHLVVVFEGDPRLRNPYSIIAVSPSLRPGGNAEGARKLIAWFVSPEGQRRIAAFRLGAEPLFHPDARGGIEL